MIEKRQFTRVELERHGGVQKANNHLDMRRKMAQHALNAADSPLDTGGSI